MTIFFLKMTKSINKMTKKRRKTMDFPSLFINIRQKLTNFLLIKIIFLTFDKN